MKICAVDMGSNAMRAVIATLHDNEIYFTHNLRWPLRLGADVFKNGTISPKRFRACEEAFGELFLEISKENVTEVHAVATSAMRDSKNGSDLARAIKQQTGIQIKTISGEEEALYVKTAVCSALNLKKTTSLLIDVGGGSAEVTLLKGEKVLRSKSFNFGTVRMLESAREDKFEKELEKLANSVKKLLGAYAGKIETCVGTGGNLRRMGKLRKLEYGRPTNRISFLELETLREEVANKSIKKRMKDYQMRRDRADVIVFAMGMIEALMAELQIDEILLPKVGLKEGLALTKIGLAPDKIHLQTKDQ